MPRTAQGKLEHASMLEREAGKINKRDPENASKLRDLARRERSKAVRQMSRRPKRTRRTVGIPGL